MDIRYLGTNNSRILEQIDALKSLRTEHLKEEAAVLCPAPDPKAAIAPRPVSYEARLLHMRYHASLECPYCASIARIIADLYGILTPTIVVDKGWVKEMGPNAH